MSPAVGDRAPSFRLRGIDNAYWILGEPDDRRSVIVVFFRREASSCRLMLPFVERLHRRASEHETEILGISLDNQRDTMEFASDYSLTFPILIETDERETTRAYDVAGVPALFLLDESLQVRDSILGWSTDRFQRMAAEHLERIGASTHTIWEENDNPPQEAKAVPLVDGAGRIGSA